MVESHYRVHRRKHRRFDGSLDIASPSQPAAGQHRPRCAVGRTVPTHLCPIRRPQTSPKPTNRSPRPIPSLLHTIPSLLYSTRGKKSHMRQRNDVLGVSYFTSPPPPPLPPARFHPCVRVLASAGRRAGWGSAAAFLVPSLAARLGSAGRRGAPDRRCPSPYNHTVFVAAAGLTVASDRAVPLMLIETPRQPPACASRASSPSSPRAC